MFYTLFMCFFTPFGCFFCKVGLPKGARAHNVIVRFPASAAEKWNHLEEWPLDQAQVQVSFTPFFAGCSRNIPQCMVFDD